MAQGFTDEQNTNFGTGEVGGDRTFTSPVHGNVASNGKDVTISQGQSGKAVGHTLISSGHASSATQWYHRDSNGKSTGHAHFDGKGNMIHGSPDYKD